MPLISVIVPMYNTEQYLDKCVKSILCSTFCDYEIILVNDGSKDGCGSLAEQYAKDDNRIRVVHKENGGLYTARNAGLEVAKGDYIAFLDSDDYIEPDMLSELYNRAKSSDADVCICDYIRVYPDKAISGCLGVKNQSISIDKLGIDKYLQYYYINYTHGHEVWNKLYKRSLLEANSIRFEKNSDIFSEDLLFNLYVLCYANIIEAVDKSFYNYLQRDGSIMYTPKPNQPLQYMELLKRFKNLVVQTNRKKQALRILPVFMFELITLSLYNAYLNKDKAFMEAAVNKISLHELFKSQIFNLAYSPLTFYMPQSNKELRLQIKGRLFGILCCMGLYKLATKVI